jgi:hypothetical protein
MNGLEGVAFFKHFVERKRVQLLSVPEVREAIWNERLKGSMCQLWNGSDFRSLTFDDYFIFNPLEWSGVTTIGPFNIQVRRTRHHIPTHSIRRPRRFKSCMRGKCSMFNNNLAPHLRRSDGLLTIEPSIYHLLLVICY